MLRLVTDPDGFFRDAAERGSLLGPVAVVSAAALLTAGQVVLYVAGAPGAGPESVVVRVLPLLAVPFVSWIFVAGALYVLSIPFSDGGGLLETVKLTGWSFLASVVDSAVTVLVVLGLLFGAGISAGSPGAVRRSVEVTSFYQVVESTPVLLVVTLWWATLLVFALRHSRKLRLREAVTVVGLPYGLVLLAVVLG